LETPGDEEVIEDEPLDELIDEHEAIEVEDGMLSEYERG
jgi:hypothetical protein